MQGGFSTPLAGLATSLARGTHQSGGWSRFPWLLGMTGLALVTPRTAVQGGHGRRVWRGGKGHDVHKGMAHSIVARQECDISVSHLYKWALRVVNSQGM